MQTQPITFGAKCSIDSKIINYNSDNLSPYNKNINSESRIKYSNCYGQILNSVIAATKTIEESKSKKIYQIGLIQKSGIDYITLNKKKIQGLGFNLNSNLQEKIIEKFNNIELGWTKKTLIGLSKWVVKNVDDFAKKLSKTK